MFFMLKYKTRSMTTIHTFIYYTYLLTLRNQARHFAVVATKSHCFKNMQNNYIFHHYW